MLTIDDAHTVLPGTDVLVVDDRIAAVGPDLAVPDGTLEIDAGGRHRAARHDRHPPAHVADGDARLRRRLDAHPVLRLVLPGVRPALPPGGRARRQPARRDRGGRRRRDDLRRLVARPADHRPRRGRGRRPALGARPVRARLRQHPAGAVGVVDLAGLPGVRPPAHRRDRRHARLPDGLRRHRRPGVPRAGGLRDRPRARRAGHHARRGLGRDQRRRHPARPRGRLPRRDAHLRARHDALGRLLPPDRGHRRLGVGVDRERAERRPGLPARPGRCARTASRCRCRWTPASGSAATCSRPCAPRWAPTAPASTWRRTPRATRSRTARCARSRSSSGRPAAAPGRWAATSDLGSVEVGKKADLVLLKNDALAGVVPAAQPVRPRRVPGPARRRAHRAGRRPRA